jgi:hypothetical protein
VTTRRAGPSLGALTGVLTLAFTAGATIAGDGDRARAPGPLAQRPPVVQRPVVETGWALLGRREVDFTRDRDTIEVAHDEGRFRKLRIVVRGAPVEIHDLKVVFGDGSVLDPRLAHHFAENTSFELDLPGDRRVIRRITFLYRSTGGRREGRATVLVYGRH